jgi:hypothetical protein
MFENRKLGLHVQGSSFGGDCEIGRKMGPGLTVFLGGQEGSGEEKIHKYTDFNTLKRFPFSRVIQFFAFYTPLEGGLDPDLDNPEAETPHGANHPEHDRTRD